MADATVEYFGGPKDGEAVQWPPHGSTVRVEGAEDQNLPHYIRVRNGRTSGSYRFNPDSKRYEWIG